MEAGLTDHVLDLNEVVRRILVEEPKKRGPYKLKAQ